MFIFKKVRFAKNIIQTENRRQTILSKSEKQNRNQSCSQRVAPITIVMTHHHLKRHNLNPQQMLMLVRNKQILQTPSWRVPKSYRKIPTWIVDLFPKNLIVNYITVCTPSLSYLLKYCFKSILRASWRV